MPDILTATVTATHFLSPHVRELTLTAPPLTFAPGQWLSFHLPVGDHPPLIRAYSLALPAQEDGTLTLCLDRVENGVGSGYLWEMEPGTVLEFAGPLGKFVLPEGDSPLLLAAHYTGIVPFRAMLRAIAQRHASPRPIRLVYSAPSPEERIYHEELLDLAAKHPWLTYHPVEDVASFLTENAATWLPFTPFIAGVRDFTLPLRTLLMDRFGFERRAVKVENFSGPTTV